MSSNIQILNDGWKLAIDPENSGVQNGWFIREPEVGAKPAFVPGTIQKVFPGYHGMVWYWNTFRSNVQLEKDSRYYLQFGAVDYLAQVFLNGKLLGCHEGGETPFEVDCSNALSFERENFLSMRVLNPKDEPVMGIQLDQTPHMNKTNHPQPGSTFNFGGIIYPVKLVKTPPIRLVDVFTKANLATKNISITSRMTNTLLEIGEGFISVCVTPKGESVAVFEEAYAVKIEPGEHIDERVIHLDQVQAWSIDNPQLYLVEVSIDFQVNGRTVSDKRIVRCGFREFIVRDGYFYLNGKRVFLRSTHTGNHYPIGCKVPHDWEYLRKDLYYAKACGYNTVRFISCSAHPDQLDFCDEIGLMVIESSYAGWCLADSENMRQRYENSMAEVIIRDRNHPSVVIWELLNETPDGPVFRCAQEYLPKLRDLDDSRLVLLASGRWDGDQSIGSVSNPHGKEWECVWGGEAPGQSPNHTSVFPGVFGGYVENAGDAHLYSITPQSQSVDKFIREIGKDTKPVYLSEYGIGSIPNVIQICRTYEQNCVPEDFEDFQMYRSMRDSFLADWTRWKMNAYAFPEDLFVDSDRLHAKQRMKCFDLVRSNPKICGYNLTGMLDHAITGEGLWTIFREWKRDIVDTASDGWAPLRWCMFVYPSSTYTGTPIQIEVVLANEDILRPGDYPVKYVICGPDGIVWEKETILTLPEGEAGGSPPLAVQSLCEEVMIDGKTGEYELIVSMERGGAPVGGRHKFYLMDRQDLPHIQAEVATWGIAAEIIQWLETQGVRCSSFDDKGRNHREIILVGDQLTEDQVALGWVNLLERIARGSTVVFFSPDIFKRGDEPLGWLPLEKKGRCYSFIDWLYHKECVANRHPLFSGLIVGLMDWDIYEGIIPHRMFDGQEAPDEVAVAAFTTGYSIPGGYASGILHGCYRFGHGRFWINTLHILDNIGCKPTADRMLLNIINNLNQYTEGPLLELTKDSSVMIKRLTAL